MVQFFALIKNRWQERPGWIFLLALGINTIALILSHNYLDGDTHSRTFMAMRWLQNPFFIYIPNDVTWVFAPLHCYLNAAALFLWYDPPNIPRILSLLLTSLTIFPLYHSVRIEFGTRAAAYAALACCFCTLFIHPAAIAASEGINLLFLFAAIYYCLRYRQSAAWSYLLAAAIFALAATMMRYDSWPLITMLALVVVIGALKGIRAAPGPSRVRLLSQAALFGVISHSFAIMWLACQWVYLGDPLYMTVNMLDVPVISQRLEEWGRLGITAYHLAFMPIVMILSLPLPFGIAAGAGLYRVLKASRSSVLLWLFATTSLYYLLTFVITLSRYPLARFVTLPTILFACFAGVGFADWLDRTSGAARRWIVPLIIVITVATPLALSQFSRPSEHPVAEKLRAISPLTNPPADFFAARAECQELLAAGHRLVLDTRNYNHRLLLVDLYEYSRQLDDTWPSADSLIRYVQANRPGLILRTRYPRLDGSIFAGPFGAEIAMVGDVPYRLAFAAGIYAVYALDTPN